MTHSKEICFVLQNFDVKLALGKYWKDILFFSESYSFVALEIRLLLLPMCVCACFVSLCVSDEIIINANHHYHKTIPYKWKKRKFLFRYPTSNKKNSILLCALISGSLIFFFISCVFFWFLLFCFSFCSVVIRQQLVTDTFLYENLNLVLVDTDYSRPFKTYFFFDRFVFGLW